jgi:nicotinamide mononucleotide transporter
MAARKTIFVSILFCLGSAALLAGAWQQWHPVSMNECLGFITGALCVLLVVKQNVWNFPVGIANNVFLFVVCYNARLYADVGLQVVFAVLGFIGWYQWLYGGANHTRLKVSRVSSSMAVRLTIFGLAATVGLSEVLRRFTDAASPQLDSLVAVFSVIAQFLLNIKRVETWYV